MELFKVPGQGDEVAVKKRHAGWAAGLLGILALGATSNSAWAGPCVVKAAQINTGPDGCAFDLVSPISFSNVLDLLGHTHTITIDKLNVLIDPTTIVEIEGSNKGPAKTSPFDFFTDNASASSTDVGLNTFPIGTTDIFSVTSLNISPAGLPWTLPLNWELMMVPGSSSSGHSMAVDDGGGNFTINSFFDVFVELSLDHGKDFTRQNGDPAAFRLQGVPEPATIALVGAGLAGVAAMRRRRHNKHKK